jgi:hypothetical protein
MINFKPQTEELLHYDRANYIEFLYNEPNIMPNWFGFSYQIDDSKPKTLNGLVKEYQSWFNNLLSYFNDNSLWVVNHDKIDLDWFPTDEDNLPDLRELFKRNKISNEFKGAIVLSLDNIYRFSKDIISYPYAVFNEKDFFYSNLDISHSELPFIIKISDHLNIDLLSTDIELLKNMMENNNGAFLVKEYSGTSIL